MDTPPVIAKDNRDQEHRLANLVSDFQYASLGCLILLGLIVLGAFSPALSQDYGWLLKIVEKFAGYACIAFSCILSFRLGDKGIMGKVKAVGASVLMCSPFFLGEAGVWIAVLAYAIISNSAARRIRQSGWRIGFTGMVSRRKDSAQASSGTVSQAV